jgi:hypothetical protein
MEKMRQSKFIFACAGQNAEADRLNVVRIEASEKTAAAVPTSGVLIAP